MALIQRDIALRRVLVPDRPTTICPTCQRAYVFDTDLYGYVFERCRCATIILTPECRPPAPPVRNFAGRPPHPNSNTKRVRHPWNTERGR